MEREAEKKAVSVKNAMQITGLGRNSMYELLKSGKIHAPRVGKKWVVPLAAIDEFLKQ